MSKTQSIYIRRRLEALSALIALALLLLAIRAFDLQVLQSEKLQKLAKQQRLREAVISAPRGIIYDRHERILASSIHVPSIATFKPDALNDEQIQTLADILQLNPQRLTRKLRRHHGFTWLKRQVKPQLAEQVQALQLPGLHIEQEWKRYHTMGPETGHLLGFVGIDGKGLEGLELSMNQVLQGKAGRKRWQRDAHGRNLPDAAWITKPEPGQNLYLSIDSTLQTMAYAALVQGVKRSAAKAGSIIVMQAKTSAVLAMANWPSYNPNHYRVFHPKEWRNRSITDMFEPGSILKPFTIATALDSGRWTEKSTVFCEHGSYRVADYTIHDDHPEGRLDLTGVLVHSSNIGSAKLALDVGPDRLQQTLYQAGFDARSTIRLPGVSSGRMPRMYQWGPVETANIAFGQGIATSNLQIATAYCAIANNGIYQQAHILKTAHDTNSKRVMSTQTATSLMRMLHRATSSEGTGRLAVPHGYDIAGKTGTAQKASRGGYDKERYTAAFAGMAPYPNPELVIVVVIDEPKTSIYGGTVAAPVFRQFAATALPYLGIAPRQQQQLARLQAPDPKAQSHQGHLYGLSLREVRRIASRQGYRLISHGSGWVVKQQPKLASDLTANALLEVWLDE